MIHSSFLEFLSLLTIALRDIAVAKCEPESNLLFFSDYFDAEEFVSRITNAKAIKLISAIDILKEKLKFYIDMKLALVTFCSDARKIMLR